jgi:hypothetical protein
VLSQVKKNRIESWNFQSSEFRKIRLTYLDAGKKTQVRAARPWQLPSPEHKRLYTPMLLPPAKGKAPNRRRRRGPM